MNKISWLGLALSEFTAQLFIESKQGNQERIDEQWALCSHPNAEYFGRHRDIKTTLLLKQCGGWTKVVGPRGHKVWLYEYTLFYISVVLGLHTNGGVCSRKVLHIPDCKYCYITYSIALIVNLSCFCSNQVSYFTDWSSLPFDNFICLQYLVCPECNQVQHW